MCGVAGSLDWEQGRGAAVVAALNEWQRHRGPDHTALTLMEPFILGNTRLAIHDRTTAGNQPFTSHDGRYVCVFNGEIYNFVELADQFRLSLPNQCDGSVIPELWALLGPDCLAYFRGMYAIAIVDSVTGTLYLARDPFGIKPLYLRRLPGTSLTFASEARALARLSPSASVSPEAIARYLHLGALPADASPFQGVEAVPPNTVLTVAADGVMDTNSILAGDRPLTGSAVGLNTDLGVAFRESIQLHLRADVPTVLLLSSGVDSTAIASAAKSMGQRLRCMTVRVPGSGDESKHAARSARHYGHTHEVVEPRLDPTTLDRFFSAMQKPSIDGLNTFVVTSAVHEAGYRVALSGLGGDEALGGYRHFRLLRWLPLLRLLDRVPQAGRLLAELAEGGRMQPKYHKLARLIGPGGPRTAASLDVLQREVHSPDRVHALTGFVPETLMREWQNDEACSFVALVEAELRNYLQAMLLADTDSFSMCWSVELRVPFVDTVFFGAATAAGAARGRPGKAALARALDDAYLFEIAQRDKLGFSMPMADWLQHGPLRHLVDALEDPSAPVWEFVSRSEARRSMRAHSDGWSEQWSLVALNHWLQSVSRDRVTPGSTYTRPSA